MNNFNLLKKLKCSIFTVDMASSDSLFSDLELYGGEGYVPYESKDPLNDPKSFTFRYKVITFVCFDI